MESAHSTAPLARRIDAALASTNSAIIAVENVVP